MNALPHIAAAPAARVSVGELTAGQSAHWDAFVRAAHGGSFFHLAGWSRVIARAFGHGSHFLLARRGDELAGVLPLVHLKSRLFGNALISMPFCAHAGVLAEDDEAREALIDEACALARRLRVDYLELRHRSAVTDWPTKSELYFNFDKPVSADHDANLKAVPKKQRAMIRKGIEAGLVSEIDAGIERFFDAYSTSVRNLGTPVFGRSYFRCLREEFGEDCEVLTAVHQGAPVASVMSFYFRDTVMPYYGGGGRGAREVKANDFMYWELMRRAVDRGYRVFDYGRSKRGTGSFDFKKHWGFEPQPLHYQYYLLRGRSMPDVSPANPKYRLFIGVWKRLPLAVTRIAGPLVARSLG